MFREDGGPTMYSHSNRTSVLGDVTTVTVCIAFGTLYGAFFIIFPGIRTEVRLHTVRVYIHTHSLNSN